VRAAIDEDHLPEAGPALAFAAVVALRAVAPFGRDAVGPEPAADGLPVDLKPVLLLQGLGEMVVVVLREPGPVQLQDLLAQAGWLADGGLPAAVPVDDALGTERRHPGLQPEDLAHAKPEHPGRLAARQIRECPFDHAQADQLVLLEQNL
jgi:hypothetical protein